MFVLQSFYKILVVLAVVKVYEQVPLSPKEQFNNFKDDWEYKREPHKLPMLNKSSNLFLEPFYSFVKDLKVQGLDNDTHKYMPLTREARISGDIIRTKVSCVMCNFGVRLLYDEVKQGTPDQDIKAKFLSICVTFQIATEEVCSGVFDTYGPEVKAVLKVIQIGPSEVCKLMLGETCLGEDVHSHEWSLDLPPQKRSIASRPSLPEGGLPVFKVLQISDTHYDLDYAEGSPANCKEPLCCRAYSTPRPLEKPSLAGKWGSYEKCDAPKALLEDMLEHIALQHPNIDYILWTGDLPPHDIWNQTKDFNLKTINDTIELVSSAFPNTPIFPAIGNHESSPAGNFAPPWMKDPNHSTSWLYNEMAESWKRWLPDSASDTVYHGAFYSVLLRPGFRLISVNTNYCHSLSWWLFVNSTDPASELKWLIHELSQAEENEEKVQIIGHIAPGSSDCMKAWSSNFYDIINRYKDTIVGLFYGHSHADEFEVFYETEEYSEAIAVAYLAPSVTSYTFNNPAYRIYYIDGDYDGSTREVLDHETWTFDLEKANRPGNRPEWYKLYSAKDTYQMSSLRPAEWNKLLEAMVTDEDLFGIFYRNYYRNSIEAPICDKQCKAQIICDLKSAKSQSRHQLCHELEKENK
ncbi:sphingomyelin phosphodiesterase-like isoform X2 [Anthonomus grandis grandis]|uniref:sphingomyelin phosphodiesterase-like isoform X2 n=1 Tax=Anthonomus grandis grandis TaxID=2921223 RepID=UPI002165FE61|nr:sphingomyelin phosphodiesterase-like isoform X2 [Anthonomus grandis grandis]